MSVSIGTVIESVIDTFRKVKYLRFGSDDANNAFQAADFGSDFVVPKGWSTVYSKTLNDAEPVVIGFVNKLAQELTVGEKSLFSTDQSGDNISFNVVLRNDGSIEIGGSDDYAVGFNEMKAQFNELNNKYNDLSTKWSTFAAAYVAGSPATQGLPPTASGSSQSNADIDKIKKENIKLQ